VQQRQQQRDQCMETAEKSKTLSQKVKDYEYEDEPVESLAEAEAIEAADLAEDAFNQQNPSDDAHREAVSEAIEDALEALEGLPFENEETEDAKDRLERLKQKQQVNDTMANEKWGIWNLEERSWVEAVGGKPLQFDDMEEARDWLNARGGMI